MLADCQTLRIPLKLIAWHSFTGGVQAEGDNWGTIRIPREDWGTLKNIRED